MTIINSQCLSLCVVKHLAHISFDLQNKHESSIMIVISAGIGPGYSSMLPTHRAAVHLAPARKTES